MRSPTVWRDTLRDSTAAWADTHRHSTAAWGAHGYSAAAWRSYQHPAVAQRVPWGHSTAARRPTPTGNFAVILESPLPVPETLSAFIPARNETLSVAANGVGSVSGSAGPPSWTTPYGN